MLLAVVPGFGIRAADAPADAIPTDDASTAAAPLPVIVAPSDSLLHYSGRFADGESGKVCAWPASAVELRFRGTAVNVRLGTGANRLEAIVDGKSVKILSAPGPGYAPFVAPAPKVFSVAAGLPLAEHRGTIFKCTESVVGYATFAGFELDAGSAVLPAPEPKRRLLVIGDSISCGYGDEATDHTEHFSPATENAYWTYGAVAAREFDANYTCIAWSGKKLFPNNTIPEIYDRILPRDAESHWPGDPAPPDVILINLCTNDLDAKQLPDHDGCVAAYREFIARLRTSAPKAAIYCALGPMVNDGYPEGRQTLTLARQWIGEVVDACNKTGDSQVRELEFARQQVADGIGADWHPSVGTHRIMAAKLADALRRDLHW